LTVVFFVSGHGFGHASRDVEIIHAFHARVPSARLIIRSAVSPSLLQRTLRVPYELRPGPCDTGIVQKTSVEHDDPATIREAIEFYSAFSDRVVTETEALRGDDVRLVVGDIPPLTFEVARRLGVPSVAIGNFTWDWIYETHAGMAGAAPWLVPEIRRAYAAASEALELPFGGGFEVFPASRRIPLVARRPTQARDDTRRHFGIPIERPAVLLSFGGYGIPSLDLAQIDCPNWSTVVTDRILPRGATSRWPHVVYLEEQLFENSPYRYEDLVTAVDVVMSKPGYGIVSECIACDTPLLYTSRGDFREYDLFVKEMPRYLRCGFIDHADLFAGRWRAGLEAVIAQGRPPETLATNGAEVAAQILEDIVRNPKAASS
jgi:L-arabinokinase